MSKPWTKDQMERLFQLKQEGMSMNALAVRYGLSKTRISQILTKWARVRREQI